MRRWRNQTYTGIGVAQAGNHLVDLMARQLATLAGLGALRDLDLQHLGIDQIVRCDAEAARGDLLDLRHFLGAVAHRVLTALAGIGPPTEAVHRRGQRLVGLGRQRAQAHAGRVEALENRFHRFHLVQGNGLRLVRETEQITQGGDRALVHQ